MKLILNKKFAVALVVALFLVAAVGGVFSLCGMSPMDHLSHWQAVSASIVQQTVLALLSLVILCTFLFIGREQVSFSRTCPAQYRDKGRVFDPLRLAFARGILNTKSY